MGFALGGKLTFGLNPRELTPKALTFSQGVLCWGAHKGAWWDGRHGSLKNFWLRPWGFESPCSYGPSSLGQPKRDGVPGISG